MEDKIDEIINQYGSYTVKKGLLQEEAAWDRTDIRKMMVEYGREVAIDHSEYIAEKCESADNGYLQWKMVGYKEVYTPAELYDKRYKKQ